MSEDTLLPCPKCGAPGVCDDGWFVGCSDLDCTLPEMMLADWNRLARAMALLRAVERLSAADAWFEAYPETTIWQARILEGAGGMTAMARQANLAGALIALATQLEARDAE